MTDQEKYLKARYYLSLSLNVKIGAIVLCLISCILLIGNLVIPAAVGMGLSIILLLIGYYFFTLFHKYKNKLE